MTRHIVDCALRGGWTVDLQDTLLCHVSRMYAAHTMALTTQSESCLVLYDSTCLERAPYHRSAYTTYDCEQMTNGLWCPYRRSHVVLFSPTCLQKIHFNQ